MEDKAALCRLAEALRILREACEMHETCIRCPLYDREEEQTACLICKTAYGSLSETIREACRAGGLKAGKGKETSGLKQTNGGRIRGMTDKELAFFLVSEDADACTHCESYDKETERCCLDNPCVKELAAAVIWDWLISETEEKGNEAGPVHDGDQDTAGTDPDH